MEIGRAYQTASTGGDGKFSASVVCSPGYWYENSFSVILANGNLGSSGPGIGYSGDIWCAYTHDSIALTILSPAQDSNLLNGGPTFCPTQSIGEPINITNGNMWLTQSDYLLPGVGENLKVARTYNSVVQSWGIFGYGWSSNYDAKLLIGGNSALIQVDLGQGLIVNFIRDGTTTNYIPLNPDFYGQMFFQGSQFQLTLKDGSIHKFSSIGRLLSQKDRNGNQTTLTYDMNGNLSGIADAF